MMGIGIEGISTIGLALWYNLGVSWTDRQTNRQAEDVLHQYRALH